MTCILTIGYTANTQFLNDDQFSYIQQQQQYVNCPRVQQTRRGCNIYPHYPVEDRLSKMAQWHIAQLQGGVELFHAKE